MGAGASAQEIVDTWHYTLRRPGEGSQNVDFDAAGWKEGFGGFGMRDTPGSRVGTVWASNRIWLRKSFEVKEIPAKPALLIHHDEDADVYLNGTQVASFEGFTLEYKVVPIAADKPFAKERTCWRCNAAKPGAGSLSTST